MVEWLKSLTIEEIALTLAFIAGVIGSITVIKKTYSGYRLKERERERTAMQSIVEEAVKKHVESLKTELADTKKQLEEVKTVLDQNNLQTARLDLNAAIEHTPQEHEAILKLAENYFLKLKGDTWMSGKLRKWSKDENVDISYIAERVPHLKG